jgi:hypothetical protein
MISKVSCSVMRCCLTNSKPKPPTAPHLPWLHRDLPILNSPKASDLCTHHQGMPLEAIIKGQAMDFKPDHIIINTVGALILITNTIRALTSPSRIIKVLLRQTSITIRDTCSQATTSLADHPIDFSTRYQINNKYTMTNNDLKIK